MNAVSAQPAIRRRRLVQIVELADSWEPRFVHSLAFREYRQLLGARSRTVKSDGAPPAGRAWYALLNVPGLGLRLRLWPFAPGNERDNFRFWWAIVRGRDLFALIAAAPESILSP